VSSAGTAAAAHHHQVSNAIKACGTLVTVEPLEFSAILTKVREPLVVWSEGGLFTKHHKYLTTYRGLTFYCKSATPLQLPADAEIIAANKISMPDL
jgi:hypothetical protein